MNESSAEGDNGGEIPLILLKTKSSPKDVYEEHFSRPATTDENWAFEPIFAPVLEHRFKQEALTSIDAFLTGEKISKNDDARYGGLIFTSQRAVEAFAKVVEEGSGQSHTRRERDSWPHLQSIPVYAVGPATSRALKSISQNPPLSIFGSETGNGEALAHYILGHYGNWYADRLSKPPLLFLVGEQRRDIIPKTLMDTTVHETRRIPVDELVVYETGVMGTFEQDFNILLKDTEDKEVRWVVVFSPTGCEAMLKALEMLDAKSCRVKTGERGGGCGSRKGYGKRRTYIATIGPTTRDYLRKTFGFEPDVCAEKPSPEGIGEAISKFMEKNY